MKKATTKAIAIVLAILMMLCSLPVMTAFAAYENTHVNTGDPIADIVAIAKTQIGYHEGSLAGTTSGTNNYTKYGVWYDKTYASGTGSFSYGAWCAMFVSWCADQAGIPADIVYPHAYCPYGVSWYKKQGLWQDSAYRGGSYTPKAGDIIYYSSNGSTATHVGLVTSCSGNYVYTVEGNTTSAVYDPEGDVCANKSCSLTNSRILGYGTPAYENATTTTSGSTATKLGSYSITATTLNVRAGASTSYDVIGSLHKGDIVTVSELASNGWGKIKLADGTDGWCSVTDYGTYLGIDALGYDITTTANVIYGDNSDGSITIYNQGSGMGYVDLALPVSVGTNTTPYLNCQFTPITGGYYFGLTQAGSGYFMMRDSLSGDELVNETSAPYMTTTETLSIDLSEWWTTENYRIDTVRLYFQAGAQVKVDYFLLAVDKTTKGTSYNTRWNTDTPTVTLMNPTTLSAEGAGCYIYENGTLTAEASSNNGYTVSFSPNTTYQPASLPYLLLDVDAQVPFNISLLVTTKSGDTWFDLGSDFYPEFDVDAATTYLPAGHTKISLDFLGCYTWNELLPDDGSSIVKQVKISVGAAGKVILSAAAMGGNSPVLYFRDEQIAASNNDKQVLSSSTYTLNGSLIESVSVGQTATQLLNNVTSDYTVALYNGGTKADASDKAKTGMTVRVYDGSTLLETYTVVVKGDVDCDGEFTTGDARMVLSSLYSTTPLTAAQKAAADMNRTGTVDSSSVRSMLCLLTL